MRYIPVVRNVVVLYDTYATLESNVLRADNYPVEWEVDDQLSGHPM
jgi:hypothetical protein